MSRPEPILAVDGLAVGYGVVPIVRDVALAVGRGEAVALLGANGAGKSTLLKAISGLLKPSAGRIRLAGKDIQGLAAETLVGRGLSHVAEGRRIFRKESVADNIQLGMYRLGLGRAEMARRRDEAFTLFPALREKAPAAAGTLSGGQQQMLAIAQALVRRPSVLMLDEPSLGLAPILVDEVFRVLGDIRAQGVSVLLVEQVVEQTLGFVDFAYVLANGRIAAAGTPAELGRTDVVRQAYLGRAPADLEGAA
ncbi:ABC transporter ATP-binding protein [Chelatococcus reniformis]|uniref:ABC transporter ATP-binding protein n=1 Tax=Chelatococcus reniformis TaxID=1494448 RepID=A0A916U9A6_9HYPH|nr:ABC transporter ATP-binding protein [Chelatococcus reniformis]GGC65302.1 ABC transporter ATP-binding protein [Chelatococcus reniformis]